MEIWQALKRSKISEDAHQFTNSITQIYDEIWTNNIYTVFVRRHVPQDEEIGNMTWLSIKRNDKEPCNDWRHFQFIKNQLVGAECEGAQLYPAESRMVDGSNQYHIWCFEKPAPEQGFPFGFFDGRTISEHPLPNGKQRAWPINMKPVDLEAQTKRVQELYKENIRLKNEIRNQNRNKNPD